MQQLQISVLGKVQGVFFRVCTKQKADQLGITGWVRNQPDGSVLVMASGTEENLQAFVQWLHQGSPMSRVETVKTHVVDADDHDDFLIQK